MPSLFRSAGVPGPVRRARLCDGVLAGQFRHLASARDRRDHPVRSIRQDRADDGAPAESLRPDADRTFPRHAGGRARRRRQYAGRLPQRPRRSRRAFARSAQARRRCLDRGPAQIHRQPGRARLQGLFAGAAAVGGAAALSFSLRRGKARRRPGRGAGRAQARAPAAQGAQHCRGRRLARAGARPCRRRRNSRRRSACARRGCCACWRPSTPPACASPNWWRCRLPPRAATSACWWCAAKAARNGWCRSTRPPSAP